MKLILTNEVSGLGSAGDIVEVKDGYGRNFLLPRGLATPWTKGGQKQVEALQKARETRAVKSLEEAQGIRGQLEARELVITAHASSAGRLFGSVTPADVADAAKAAGVTIDRRTIEFVSPIRSTGQHQALVRLHPEVQATAKLSVVSG